MAKHLGDFALGTTIYGKFCTVGTTGAPTVLAGSPVVSVYENDDNVQITAGVTLNVDEDAIVGLNQLVIVASGANGYEAGKFYEAIITTGTVGGTSVVGYDVVSFTIEATSALRPTVAARTLDVTAGGNAGIDWANVEAPTTALNLSATNIDVDQVVASVSGAVGSVTGAVGSVTAQVNANVAQISGDTVAADNAELFFDGTGYAPAVPAGPVPLWGLIESGTAQAATASTLTMRAASAFADNTLAGATVMVLGSAQGYWQSAVAASNVGATDVITMLTNWVVTPTGTITYVIIGTAPGSATPPDVNVVSMLAGVITAAVIAANAVDADALAADAVTEIRDSIFTRAFSAAYSSLTFDEMIKVMIAALAGKASGLATTTATYRNLADNADVIVATVDVDGNRTAVTRTP